MVPLQLGRYVLFDEIAAGGMASVHLGRAIGAMGFSRSVAIKRLLPPLARDPDFVAMFIDEARLASRIRHPNVVPTLDVVALDGELFVVLEYVHGASLAELAKVARADGHEVPLDVILAIMMDTLHGLHAAHEAHGDDGPLHIVHRDVSPQNILVGVDGVARVADFGVAKAASRTQTTRDRQIKGKLGYMAPEQLDRGVLDPRADVYAASVVLWEMLAGRRLFVGDGMAAVALAVRQAIVPPLPDRLPQGLEGLVRRGMARAPEERFASALDMARQLETVASSAPQHRVGEWVRQVIGARLESRAARIAEIERGPVPPHVEGEAHRECTAPAPSEVPTLQVSAEGTPHLTASVARHPPHRFSRWAVGFAVAAVASVLAAVAVLPRAFYRARVADAVPPSATGSQVVEPPPAEPPSSAVAPAPLPTASAAPSRPAITPATKKGDCDPPYVIDARQIKHFKRQCFP